MQVPQRNYNLNPDLSGDYLIFAVKENAPILTKHVVLVAAQRSLVPKKSLDDLTEALMCFNKRGA